ncbi:PPE domain-containing protein [Saccharopolyspora thermophila]|uniref:PPE domain-containing protein n=1 Tax=Saccharopolyspora thermophila TaxID=89367 RepID=UPI001E5D6125|nr:PPE domain-containing protein [Saccharopolyspora subtropica]
MAQDVREGAGQVFDAGADLFGYDSRAEMARQAMAHGLQHKNEQLRQDLEAQNRSLMNGMGFDPASITQQENWQSYSHRELYDTNQRSLDQAKATEVARQWREIADKLRAIGPELQQEASAAIQGGWEGEAADAANRSAEPLVQWMSGSADAFQMTGNKIEEAATAAGQVKVMVPEPEGHHYGRTFLASVPTGVGAPIDVMAQMRERQQAERAAQETMGRVLSPTYSNVDSSVPAFRDLDGRPVTPPPPPPPPPIDPPPPPVTPTGRTGRSSSATGTGHVEAGPGEVGAGIGGVVGSGPTAPAGTGAAWAPGGGGTGSPGALPGTGVPGRAGVGDPGVGFLPGPGMVSRPGGGAGTGRGGAGGLGAGAGKAGGLGAGRFGAGPGVLGPGGRAGSGGLGAGARAAGAGGAGASAARGAGAGAGMAGAGQRGQGGEDQEHERPSWLQEQDDVWLDDMPRTAPPVFGA